MSDDVLTEDSRRGRRVRYEHIVNTVDERTGDGLGPWITRLDLTGRLRRDGLPDERVDRGIDAALENGDLYEFPRPDGLGLCYVLNEPESLRDAIVALADADHPNQDRIGDLNEQLERLREAADD